LDLLQERSSENSGQVCLNRTPLAHSGVLHLDARCERRRSPDDMHGGGGEVAKVKVIYVDVAIILDSLDCEDYKSNEFDHKRSKNHRKQERHEARDYG
jgi:hypothetical protein